MKTLLQTLKKKWSHYLLESFVITAGILMAFGLNNWNEGRKSKLLEIKLLKSLLEVSYQNNEDALWAGRRENNNLRVAKTIKFAIENDLPYSDSLSNHLFQLDNHTKLYMDYSAYETLKQYGLNNISNDSVRLRITDAYGQFMNLILDFQLRREERVMALYDLNWFKGDGVPVDFEKLKKDPQFNYLVDFQIREAEQFRKLYAPPGFWVAKESGGFIPMLEAEIARLEGK